MTEAVDEIEEGKSARDSRLALLRFRRDRALAQGVTVEIGGEAYRFTSDDTSRARLDQAALDAQQSASGWSRRWRTIDGWVALDVDAVEAARSAVVSCMEAVFQRYEELEAEIQSADNPEQIALDGWP